jgi:hypothetical protein
MLGPSRMLISALWATTRPYRRKAGSSAIFFSTFEFLTQTIAASNQLSNSDIKNGLWMYLDSGASRSVIQEYSPIGKHLLNVSETMGSCNVGNKANLKYIEKGTITTENEVTVVEDLKYDLYAAVAAAKRGVTCIIDFKNGKNKSYLYCKYFGSVTPLIENKNIILEVVPVHLYVNKSNDVGLMAKQVKSKPSMSKISKFWLGWWSHRRLLM